MQARLLYSLEITMCLFLVACAGPPPTPTATQYLIDARNNLNASDFNAALRNLDRSIRAGSEAGQQAGVLRAVLLTALAEGGKQMAEAYGAGLKEPGGQLRFGDFNRMRNDYYGIARVRLM